MKRVCTYFGLAVLLCAAACSKNVIDSTSLEVTIGSDLTVLTEVDRVDVVYTSPRGSSAPQSLTLTASTTFPITMARVASPGPEGELLKIRVTAFLNNVAVVSQKITTALIAKQHAGVKLTLNRDCFASVVNCDDDLRTCIKAQCVDVPTQAATVIESDAGAGDDAMPDGATATPIEPLADCKLNSDCSTGYCADGVCCDTACTEKCRACNLPGKIGMCSTVLANAPDPHKVCVDDKACGTSGLCDGNGECAVHPKTKACGAATSCVDGKYTQTSYCDGAGTCVNEAAAACPSGSKCADGMCNAKCSVDADCGFNTFYCEGTACKLKVANGVACGPGKGNTCTSGNCVDGVCCGSSSCGSCQRCDLNGAGTCSAVALGQPDPIDMCVDQGAASCGNNGVCGAGGSCQKYACTCDGFAMPNPASSGLPNLASYTAGSGIVTDNVTKLVWEQPISTATFTQAAALKYCTDKGGVWRLPTVVELYSLVDFTRSSPAIDVGAFPNTPSNAFWTSSAVAGSPSYAWLVNFGSGYSPDYGVVGYSSQVRCVR